MKAGDIIINPYVPKLINGIPNPMYATIYLGTAYNGNLRYLAYNGRVGEWVMPSDRPFEIVGHINIFHEIAKYVDYDEVEE